MIVFSLAWSGFLHTRLLFDRQSRNEGSHDGGGIGGGWKFCVFKKVMKNKRKTVRLLLLIGVN